MSEQDNFLNPQIEEVGNRSSQDTLCSQDNAENNKQDDVGIFQNEFRNGDLSLPLSEADIDLSQMSESYQGTYTQEIKPQSTNIALGVDPSVFIDEETQMFYEGSPTVESPRDVTSPCETGDISSPFEAMESDGLVDADETIFSASGATTRRTFPSSWQPTVSTTTPGGSSDEDPYASSGSRKKRRKTRREMQPLYYPQDPFYNQYYSPSSQIPSPVPDTITNETEDSNTAHGGNFIKPKGNSQTVLNNSDSKLFATILNANRRYSNASESGHSTVSFTRDNTLSVADSSTNASIPVQECDNSPQTQNKKSPAARRRTHHHHRNVPLSSPSLQTPYPSSYYGCSLHILVQPEQQHRARYLTEGSRGPVKDSIQQGYPQLQLKGYTGKTTLHVFVGSESDDKIRPHGFYQACKVTGRNTTQCEEVEVEGTKVIHIPFDAQEIISVDCVGILKLRNADVEARIGVTRAKKRSQTVRLVFRVILDDIPTPNNSSPCILQVVSNRINCTQPRGQPEITKKSLERCPVEGGQEMFIIGRNFHKGIKVIFQDSEEPDGSHWRMSGQIDKDTFNQTHMVVHIPPYHDLNITRSVNVQLFVEHNARKCDPHSFTYDPSPKVLTKISKESTSEKEGNLNKDPEDAVKAILEGKVDRKYLESLFAKLLRPSEGDSKDIKPSIQATASDSSSSSQLPVFPTLNQQSVQPLRFTSGDASLPETVQKPVPIQNSSIRPTSQVLIRPNIFTMTNSSSLKLPCDATVVMSSQLCGSNQNTLDSNLQPTMNQTSCVSFPGGVGHNVFTSNEFGSSGNTSAGNMVVKSESQVKCVTGVWPDQHKAFPAMQASMPGFPVCPTLHSGGNVVFSASGSIATNASLFQLPVVAQQPSVPNTINSSLNESSQAGTSMPPQASTPVQDNTSSNSTFTTQQDQWPVQVVGAAPNIVFDKNVQTSTNAFAFSMAQSMAVQSAASSQLSQTEASSVTMQQIQGNLWQPHPGENVDVSSSNQMWQTGHQQSNQFNVLSHNVNDSANIHQQNPGFVFNGATAQNTNNQQQYFTIPGAMQILDQTKTSLSSEATSAGVPQDSNAFSRILLLSPTEVSSGGNPHPTETLNSPTVLSDTGLSVGFDNNFTLNDNDILVSPKVMEHSVLQTIISDCTNNSSFAADESKHTDQTSLFEQSLQLSSQEIIDNSSMTQPVMPPIVQTNTGSKSIDIVEVSGQHYGTGSDVDVMNILMKQEEQFVSHDMQSTMTGKQEDISKQINIDQLLNEVVDTNMFLVNPNCVQPIMQQSGMVVDTPSCNHSTGVIYTNASEATPTVFQPNQDGQLMGNSQNEQVVVVQGTDKSDLQTIDGSVLGLTSGNSNDFDQAFNTFTQMTPSGNS